ncbi:protein of unknown function [Ralstonia solanacearum PSI07]|nr:protein of unknown function [Ralstonia solanacearum PSI07]
MNPALGSRLCRFSQPLQRTLSDRFQTKERGPQRGALPSSLCVWPPVAASTPLRTTPAQAATMSTQQTTSPLPALISVAATRASVRFRTETARPSR